MNPFFNAENTHHCMECDAYTPKMLIGVIEANGLDVEEVVAAVRAISAYEDTSMTFRKYRDFKLNKGDRSFGCCVTLSTVHKVLVVMLGL